MKTLTLLPTLRDKTLQLLLVHVLELLHRRRHPAEREKIHMAAV
jgi:hypothetical protein